MMCIVGYNRAAQCNGRSAGHHAAGPGGAGDPRATLYIRQPGPTIGA